MSTSHRSTPVQLASSHHSISITVWQALQLIPPKTRIFAPDTYLTVYVDQHTLDSDIVKRSLSPEYNTRFVFPYKGDPNVRFRVFDKKNRIIGHADLLCRKFVVNGKFEGELELRSSTGVSGLLSCRVNLSRDKVTSPTVMRIKDKSSSSSSSSSDSVKKAVKLGLAAQALASAPSTKKQAAIRGGVSPTAAAPAASVRSPKPPKTRTVTKTVRKQKISMAVIPSSTSSGSVGENLTAALASVLPAYHGLRITLLSGRDLYSRMDRLTLDPYVVLTCGSVKVQGPVKKNGGKNPNFLQCYEMPWDGSTRFVKVSVHD
eukprot:Lankesteria_metandrocarpae@DN3001_c0_g1_i2.p1